MADTERQTGGEVLERTKQETKRPDLFKVLLLNDDYTTMDFVIEVLESIFNKAPAEAYRIMMAVHTQGKGLCGVYTFDIAETKVQTVIDRADKDSCFRWSLYYRPPIATWSTRRATLLGDAVHATLPYLAQGAAMAIEDGAVLTRALQSTEGTTT